VSALSLRPYDPADLPAIVSIYDHYVMHSVATFDLVPPGEAAMRDKFGKMRGLGHPLVVALADGELVGYAYASTYRDRPAYRFTAEDTVYVAPGRHGQGIGKALLARVIADGRTFGFRQMLGVITAEGTASVALHEKLGFKVAGHFPGLGYKFDRWLDVVHVQLSL
jgi:L-amino acid N-acyltransferase YncA